MTGKNQETSTVNIATDTAYFEHLYVRAYPLIGKELPAKEVFEHLFEGRRALDSETFQKEATRRLLEAAFPPPLAAPPPEEPLHQQVKKRELLEAVERLSLQHYHTATLGNRLLTPSSDFVSDILPYLLALAGFGYYASALLDDWTTGLPSFLPD